MLRAGHGLILIVAALLAMGVVMVTSAGLSIGAEPATLGGVLLGRPAMLAAAALAAMLVAAHLPTARLVRMGGAWAAPAAAAVILLLLAAVYVPGLGREVNGARRWVHLGPLGFQPSEAAKWGMVFVLAWWAAGRPRTMGRFFEGLLPAMLLLGAVCALVAGEDLGTALLIAMVGAALLVAAGAKLWHAAVLAVPGAVGVVAALVSSPYRLDRVRAFLDPYRDPQGIGYHMIQSMATVAAGGPAGRGLGNSVRKFGYLPEDTTDFIFAVICEELGVIGAAVVASLYAALLLCGWSIVRRRPEPVLRLLGLGILLTIGLQALINMSVVTGLAPTKGIALPLISSGGTGWVMTAFCVGLLVSLDATGPRRDHAIMAEPVAGG